MRSIVTAFIAAVCWLLIAAEAPQQIDPSLDSYLKQKRQEDADRKRATAEEALSPDPNVWIRTGWRQKDVAETIVVTGVVLFALIIAWRLKRWYPSWIKGNWRAQVASGAILCAASIGSLLVVYDVDRRGYGERDWDALRHPVAAFAMVATLAIGVGLIVYASLHAKSK